MKVAAYTVFLFLLVASPLMVSGTCPLDTHYNVEKNNTNPSFTVFASSCQGDDFATTLATCDINGDGKGDLIVGAPNWNGPNGASDWQVGRVIVHFGDSNTEGTLNIDPAAEIEANPDLGLIITGLTAEDHLGSSIACGDVNGDSISDLVVCAPTNNDFRGFCYVLYGNTNPKRIAKDVGPALTDGTLGFYIKADYSNQPRNASSQNFGWDVAVVDLNADGYGDVCVGGYGSALVPGRVFCVFGAKHSPGVLPVDVKYSLFGLVTFEGVAGDNAGWSVTGGDVNGDKIDDLIIGAIGRTQGYGDVEGGIWVVYGSRRPFPRTMYLNQMNETQGFSIIGTAESQRLGWDVAAGDINGDGVDDIAVSSINDSPGGEDFFQAGSVYIIYGAPLMRDPNNVGFVKSVVDLDSSNGVQLTGAQAGDFFGRSLSFGDVNGDGVTDLIVGSSDVSRIDPENPRKTLARTGQVVVLFGACPFSTFSLSTRELGKGGLVIESIHAHDTLGYIASPIDFRGRGNGYADIAIGSEAGGFGCLFWGCTNPELTCDKLNVTKFFPEVGHAGGDGSGDGSGGDGGDGSGGDGSGGGGDGDGELPLILILNNDELRANDVVIFGEANNYTASIKCGISKFTIKIQETTAITRPLCIYVRKGELPDIEGGVYDYTSCVTTMEIEIPPPISKKRGIEDEEEPCDVCNYYISIVTLDIATAYSIVLSYDPGCDGCGGVSDICGDCLAAGSGYAGPTNYRLQDQDTLDRSLLTLQLMRLLDTLNSVSTSINEIASKLRSNYTAATMDFTEAFQGVAEYATKLQDFDYFVQHASQSINAKKKRK